ncbi:MAG TPA: PAS domain S-box protein [Thermodesulfobacteriota bacterium]|nr:PAS domain S-box protein [Thermodesulfobacteriota bacterium]
MNDGAKTKKQLIDELQQLRQHVAELKTGEHLSAISGLDAVAASEALANRCMIAQQYDTLFSQAISSAAANIFCLDLNTREFLASEPAKVLHGLPPDTSLNYDIATAMIHSDDRPRVEATWQSCMDKGSPFLVEYRVVQPDGSIRWIAALAQLLPGLQGAKLVGICRDITERKQAEEKLRESEKRYRLLFEAMTEGFVLAEVILDEQGIPVDYRVLEANPAAGRLTGISSEMAIGKTARELVPGIRAEWIETLGRVALTGEPISFDCYARSLNKWFHVLAYSPEQGRFACLFVDITERKQAIDALQGAKNELEVRVKERTRELLHTNQQLLAQGETLQKIVDNIPVMIASYDQLGNVHFVNRQLRELLNISAGDIGHTDGMALAYPKPQYHRSVPTCVQEESAGWKDIIMQVADGKQLEASWRHVRLSDGSYIGIGMDITERKQAEAALRESERQFRSLFMESPVSIIIHDRDSGEIIDANPNAFASYGINSLEELKANTFWMGPPYSFAEALYWIRKTAAEGPQQFEWLNRKVTGELFWEQVYLNRVTINGVERVLATTIDTTKRKQAEQALRVSEANLHKLSSELLQAQENERKRVANEVHDNAGQVLSAVKYRVEGALLKMKKTQPNLQLKPIEELVPLIQRCVEDMRRLQMELRPSMLDEMGLLATIRWFCRQFRITHPSMRVEQDVAIKEADVPEQLKIMVFRVLQEAMNNAGKHSDAKFVRLSVGKNRGALTLRIEDSGQGFDLTKAHQVQAFNKGLGLSSMRERVHYSGGRLSIQSVSGRGTCIEARWPKKALVYKFNAPCQIDH